MTSPHDSKSYNYVPTLLQIENCTHQGQLDQAWPEARSTSLDTSAQVTILLQDLKRRNWEDYFVRKYKHPGVFYGGDACGHGGTRRLSWCQDYSCLPCQKKKAGRAFSLVRDKVEGRMKIKAPMEITKGDRTIEVPVWTGDVRFLTLTTIPDGDLVRAWESLGKHLKKFKQRKSFKLHFVGGHAGIEIHYFRGNDKNPIPGWRFDIHILAEGSYWPVEEIRKNWKDISGAFEVWIEKVQLDGEALDWEMDGWDERVDQDGGQDRGKTWELGEAILEVCKYITKPQEMAEWPPEARREFQRFMEGGRREHTHVHVKDGQDISIKCQTWTGRKLGRSWGCWNDIPELDEDEGGEGIERFPSCPYCQEILWSKWVLDRIGDVLPNIHRWLKEGPPPLVRDLLSWVFKPVEDRRRCLGCMRPHDSEFVECPRCGRSYCPSCVADKKTCLMCGTDLVAPAEDHEDLDEASVEAQGGPPEAPDGPCLALMPSDEALAILRYRYGMRHRMEGQGRYGWAMDRGLN